MQIFAETFSWNAPMLIKISNAGIEITHLSIVLESESRFKLLKIAADKKRKERRIPDLWNKNSVWWTFGLHLCTSERSGTSFLSCSSVSGCPISWSNGLSPASPSLWPLFPRCNCLRVWWTCVSEADNLSRRLVIKARSPFHPWPTSQTTFSHWWWRQHPPRMWYINTVT